MRRRLAQITLVVKDYDDAIEFYTKKLGFILVEDTILNESKRWIVIKPSEGDSATLLLAQASGTNQQNAIGNQTGGRVFLFMHTNDIEAERKNLLENSVTIIRDLSNEPFGKVLVFADLYGNLWDLIEPSGNSPE